MTSRETVERIAETIYGAMRFDRSPAAPEWVPGGNSDAQVIARQAATNIAAAILHGIAGRAEAVAEVVQSEQTGGHALHFPAGYAETLDSLPIGTKLYTHPPASVPEYDRALIADMLIGCAAGKRGEYTTDCMLEQARLLREADNASAAKVRTVSRASAPEVTDAMAERAAIAVAEDWQREQSNVVLWPDLPEGGRELARAQVRVVLAALQEQRHD